MEKIIALVGLCGTGKSEVSHFLTQQGYETVYFGGVVMETLQAQGLEINPDNERRVREALRAEHGMAAMAILRQPKINELLAVGKKVAIDGLYSTAELDILKTAYGARLQLWAIHSPKALRYARLANRPHRPLTAAQVDERDYFEIKNLDKGGPIALADVHILNDGNRSVLQTRLAAAFAAL